MWLLIYAFIKFWLPIVTAFGLMIKGFFVLRSSMGDWAAKFLDNHMAHIQDVTEQSSVAVRELATYHKEMLRTQDSVVRSIELISRDFHDHTLEDQRVQGAILTGIEVIKSKL